MDKDDALHPLFKKLLLDFNANLPRPEPKFLPEDEADYRAEQESYRHSGGDLASKWGDK